MNGESLLNLLQQRLLSHPDYAHLAQKLKNDVQNHPTRDEQRTILSALSKYDKENKLITTVQQCMLSLGYPNLTESTSEALVALIQKERSTVFVLHQFLNHPLPPCIRCPLYSTIISEEEVGAAYRDSVRDKPYATFSPQENLISEKVKNYIRNTPGFSSSEFLHSNRGEQLMTKTLSYWHIHVGRPLTDIDYKLVMPIVSLTWPDSSPVTVAKVVSLLAGTFNLLHALKATDTTTLNIVLQYVQLANPELSEHIMLLRADLSSSHTTSTAQLVATLHEKLFVGYLSEDVIKFLLDQCVITRDVPSYNPLFSFTATVLCLCASALSQCNNVSSALSHIEQRGGSITVRQIQHYIQTHYIDSLATQLSTKPTRVSFQSKPTTLGATSPPGHHDDQKLIDEIEELKKKLAEEKKERNDRHVAHRNEVGILRAENEDLKKRLKASKEHNPTPAVTVVPPAPVRQSTPPSPKRRDSTPRRESTPPPPSQPTTQPDDSDDGDIKDPLTDPLTKRQVENLWLDVARNVMQRVKRLAFKNPVRKRELDTMSFFLNKQYEVDRAAAEVKIFGSVLSERQWDAMSESEYYDKIYEVDRVVEQLARDRLVQYESRSSDGSKSNSVRSKRR